MSHPTSIRDPVWQGQSWKWCIFFSAEKHLNEEDSFRWFNKAFDFDRLLPIVTVVYFNHDHNRSQTLSK